MKTEMSEDGVITIRPESSVEAYALRRWMEFQRIEESDGAVHLESIDTSKLLINAIWPARNVVGAESPEGILNFLDDGK